MKRCWDERIKLEAVGGQWQDRMSPRRQPPPHTPGAAGMRAPNRELPEGRRADRLPLARRRSPHREGRAAASWTLRAHGQEQEARVEGAREQVPGMPGSGDLIQKDNSPLHWLWRLAGWDTGGRGALRGAETPSLGEDWSALWVPLRPNTEETFERLSSLRKCAEGHSSEGAV